MTDTPATIALGDPSQTHLNGPEARTEQHPVGMTFYKRSWPVDQLGKVRYVQGPHSFDLSRVTSVMGSCDRANPQRGIYAWDINAFPMDGPTIPHQQARDELFRLFAQLRQAGWTRYVEPFAARLEGEQALRHFLQRGGHYALDPTLIPTMQDWMRINQHLPYWQFWAGGSYLMLRVIDEPSLRGLERDGVYMFSIDIDSESSNFGNYFNDVEQKRHWQKFVLPEIEAMHQQRIRTEAELRSQGYTIDTSYQDPPILALGNGAHTT